MPTRALVTRYEDDLKLFADLWHWVGLVAAFIAVSLFWLLANDYWLTIANNALIAVVGAVAMMILTGFAGQVSLGHAAFLAVGAYTVGLLSSVWGWPFWLCLPCAGIAAALVGMLVGPFALRLEGLYLAIVTIGLLFLVDNLLRNGLGWAFGRDYLSVPMYSWFQSNSGDADALGSFRRTLSLGGMEVGFQSKLFILFVGLATACTWMGKNLQRSNAGRAMMAVRERGLAAAALGVNAGRTKMVAFGVSSFFAGVAGAMYAFAHPVLTLEPFGLLMSVEYIAMVVLGGVGTMFGAVWGALFYVMLKPVGEMVGDLLPLPVSFSSEQRSVLLFFVLLCVFLIFEPLGLLGIWLRIKRYFLAWPFRY